VYEWSVVIDAVLARKRLHLAQDKDRFGWGTEGHIHQWVVLFQRQALPRPNRKPNGIGLRQGHLAEIQRNICASSLILENELLGRGDFSGFGCALVLQHRCSD
jgi:hypothetical protein